MISNFRITRLSENLFRIEIVASSKAFENDIREGFSKRLVLVFGKRIQLEFAFSDTIEKDKSGKFRFFVDERKRA